MLSRCCRIRNFGIGFAGFIVAVECGCDVQVHPLESASEPGTQSSAPRHVRDRQLVEVDNHLESLRKELAAIDTSLSAEVAALQREIETKIDREEVRSLIEKEFARMQIRERVARIGARTEQLEKRLDAFEEPFGILPRNRDAPWVDAPKKQPVRRGD